MKTTKTAFVLRFGDEYYINIATTTHFTPLLAFAQIFSSKLEAAGFAHKVIPQIEGAGGVDALKVRKQLSIESYQITEDWKLLGTDKF